MFNSLKGKLTYRDGEAIHLETSGIEWEVQTTGQSLAKFPDPGIEIRVFTYLYHREDQVRLFGFAQKEERDLFLKLIRVDGVGPRLALKILSGISVENFISAIDNEDIDSLIYVPGLGRKTAQKIILKLRDKLTPASDTQADAHSDIIDALVAMGFDRRVSRRAVIEILKGFDQESVPREDFEGELLKRAIRLVSNKL